MELPGEPQSPPQTPEPLTDSRIPHKTPPGATPGLPLRSGGRREPGRTLTPGCVYTLQGDCVTSSTGHIAKVVSTIPGTVPTAGDTLVGRGHGYTYVGGERAGQVPTALTLGGERGAAGWRLPTGAGREAEVHHRHGGEGPVPRLPQPGVCQKPRGRRGRHSTATAPAPHSAIPGQRGVRALGTAGSGTRGTPLLPGSSQLGDAQLEVQRLLQRMHGSGADAAGDNRGSLQGWGAPVPPEALPQPSPAAMPVPAAGCRPSGCWLPRCWHGDRAVPSSHPAVSPSHSGQRAGHGTGGPPTSPRMSPACPLCAANPQGQHSPLADYQTLPRTAKSAWHLQLWSYGVPVLPPHPSVCLSLRACPSEAFPSGGGGRWRPPAPR